MSKSDKKHLYEGMYIISATLSDDARQKAVERIQSGISQEGGEIKKIFDQGRKRLAYDIDGHREGYYYILYFEAPPVAITEHWRDCHLNEDLVRFITLRAEVIPEKIAFKPLVEE